MCRLYFQLNLIHCLFSLCQNLCVKVVYRSRNQDTHLAASLNQIERKALSSWFNPARSVQVLPAKGILNL